MNLRNLTLTQILLMLTGNCVILVAAGVAYWEAARHMGWWTFSLAYAGGWLLWEIAKSTREVIRDRKARK